MKRRVTIFFIVLFSLVWGCGRELPSKPTPSGPGDPVAALQQIAEALRERTGAPGAVLGVARGDRRWRVAAGHEDLLGLVPMAERRVFRAGSIIKLLTGSLIMRAIEQGKLSLDDKLSRFVPSFPRASSITVDMLLSHTGGVTTAWFDQPALQAEVTEDLSRVFNPHEVIARLAREKPAGEPGESSMQYANLDFVLLGEILAQLYGMPVGSLIERDVLSPLQLKSSSVGFENPPELMSGFLEFMGIPLDASIVDQTALLSFAGSAGALNSNLDDLLSLLRALFRDGQLVQEKSLKRLMLPAEQGSWYGRAAMRFCPCDGSVDGYSGIGHGGNLPGYWSVAVYYPALDVAVVAAINRDSVDGVSIDRHVFDASMKAVVDLFAR